MANTPQFVPTAENTYVISYPIHGTDAAYDFAAILARSRTCERQGDVEQACNLRYEGVKKLMDLIPDEDEVQLDWEEEENQSVLELLKRSAIDHFLVGDFEMAAGMMEMLLDIVPGRPPRNYQAAGILLPGARRLTNFSTKSSTTSATNIRKKRS